MTEPEVPAGDRAAAPPSRQVLFVVGGGLILVLAAALGVTALISSGDTSPPHAKVAAADHIVPSPPATPPVDASGAPASEPASAPATEPAGSQAAPTPTKAAPTRTPAAPRTTAAPPPAGSQVTAAQITVSPDSKRGFCDPGSDLVTVHVTITVSQPGVRLRFTVNGGGEHGGIAQSKTYTDSFPISIPHVAGEHRVELKVSAPSIASSTAIYTFTCGGH